MHELPVDLAKALAEKDIICTWEALSAIGRNEFICWVEDAKQEKTRVKRIIRATEELLDGKKRPCCWVGCIHRTDKKPSKWQQDVLIDKKISKKANTSNAPKAAVAKLSVEVRNDFKHF